MQTIKLTKKQISKLVKAYEAELTEHADMFTTKLPQRKATGDERVRISFSERAIEMSRALVDQCDKEIAWNATVTRVDDKTFVIDNVYIFPQIVTGTTVDVDHAQYAQWIADIPEDVLPYLRCHCHSHVNMGVFSSGTDDDYQKQLVQGNVNDYYIFLIFNKKGNVFARVYDVEHNIFYDNADIDIDTGRRSRNDEAAEWIDKYVTLPSAKPASPKVGDAVQAYAAQMSLSEYYRMRREMGE